MSKAAIIVAKGCEEGETLTIVDILRRAEITCHMFGITSDKITGAHNITIKTNFVLSEKLTDYDMIILPGGYGGVEEMMNCNTLLDTLNDMHSSGQYIAAICAAPLVLDKAGLLKGKNFTCYPSVNKKISSGSRLDDKIVIDDTLITSQGPATAYAFAFELVRILGGDAAAVQDRMLYHNAFSDEEKKQVSCEFPPVSYAPSDKKAAVLMVEGYEESETMQIVDLLRRANVTVHTFRFQNDPFVLSMEQVLISSDKTFSEEVKNYDIIIVPGGRTAGAKLIANENVMEMLRYFDDSGKLIAGMCSGTTVLHAAGVMKGKKVTGYRGYESKLTGAVFSDDVVVYDQNLITSQGPATPYPFAFKIIEALGIDPKPIKERLLYKLAGGK